MSFLHLICSRSRAGYHKLLLLEKGEGLDPMRFRDSCMTFGEGLYFMKLLKYVPLDMSQGTFSLYRCRHSYDR